MAAAGFIWTVMSLQKEDGREYYGFQIKGPNAKYTYAIFHPSILSVFLS